MGPRAMGKRLTSECHVTPITCFCLGSVFETSPMVPGSEIADQDRKRNEPATTACHLGMAATRAKPAIAIKLKTSSDRFGPIRSASHPPGNEYRADTRLLMALRNPGQSIPLPSAIRYMGRNRSDILSPIPTSTAMHKMPTMLRRRPMASASFTGDLRADLAVHRQGRRV